MNRAFETAVEDILDDILASDPRIVPLGIAEFCEVLTLEKFADDRAVFAKVLFKKLCAERDRKPPSTYSEMERQMIKGILALLSLLDDQGFSEFFRMATDGDKNLAEIHLLVDNARWYEAPKERMQTLTNYLIGTRERIIQGKKDIYSKENYRYRNGLYIIRDEDYIMEIYNNMSDQNCILLLLLDLVCHFIPLNGYGYRFNDRDYQMLERAGFLKAVEHCSPSQLKLFIQEVITCQNNEGTLRYIEVFPEDYARLIKDFWKAQDN